METETEAVVAVMMGMTEMAETVQEASETA
jgi:hypothetical protein